MAVLRQKLLIIDEGELNKTSKRRVKVVEEGGNTLTQLLFKSDPWADRGCKREKCQACKVEGGETVSKGP